MVFVKKWNKCESRYCRKTLASILSGNLTMLLSSLTKQPSKNPPQIKGKTRIKVEGSSSSSFFPKTTDECHLVWRGRKDLLMSLHRCLSVILLINYELLTFDLFSLLTKMTALRNYKQFNGTNIKQAASFILHTLRLHSALKQLQFIFLYE